MCDYQCRTQFNIAISFQFCFVLFCFNIEKSLRNYLIWHARIGQTISTLKFYQSFPLSFFLLNFDGFLESWSTIAYWIWSGPVTYTGVQRGWSHIWLNLKCMVCFSTIYKCSSRWYFSGVGDPFTYIITSARRGYKYRPLSINYAHFHSVGELVVDQAIREKGICKSKY